MNEKQLTQVLDQLAERYVPEVDLWPAIRERLEKSKPSPFQGDFSMENKNVRSGRQRRFWRLAAIVSLAVLIVAGLIAGTPQGRVLAQSVLRLFSRVDAIPVPATPRPASLVEVTPREILPTPTPQVQYMPEFSAQCGDMNNPRCTIDQIRGLVDFPVKTLLHLPEGLAYAGATGGPEGVSLIFRNDDMTSVLILSQSLQTGNEVVPWAVGNTASIEAVSVGANPGEYVKGLWNSSPEEDALIWDAMQPRQALRWVEGNVVISMTWFGNPVLPSVRIDKDSLLLLASELTTHTVAQANAFNLNTAAQAEELLGFKVIEPAWLPDGFSFVSADALLKSQTACLHYTSSDGTPIDIAESMTQPLPAVTDLFPVHPTFGRNMQTEVLTVGGGEDGKGLYATGYLDATNDCGSVVDNKVLQVQAGPMALSIYSPDFAVHAPTHLEMVKIAESITGIETVSQDQLDPERLHSVEDAQQLAGFHILQPTRLPEGKVFAYATYTQVGEQRTVHLVYNDDHGSITLIEVLNPTDTLESIYEKTPVEYDKVTVNDQPALISQGFYNNKVWMKLAGGGDGAAAVIWYENGVKYEVTGFNGLSTQEWLAIAASLK